jgi:hypothetical protein
MIKKRMTGEVFDKILPGNVTKGVLAARSVLVDGITYRAASETLQVSISAIQQAIHRIERVMNK